MPYFSFNYNVSEWLGDTDKAYVFFIQADDFPTAKLYAEQYKDVSWKLPSISEYAYKAPSKYSPRGVGNLLRAKMYPAALHEACYLGYFAMKTGKYSIEQILGDDGLVHAIAHIVDGVFCSDDPRFNRDDLNCLNEKIDYIARFADEIEAGLQGYVVCPENIKGYTAVREMELT